METSYETISSLKIVMETSFELLVLWRFVMGNIIWNY